MTTDAKKSYIAEISKAERMLEKATTVEEIRHVENLAQRARDYAKAAGLGRDAVNRAGRLALDARRKTGATLKAMKERGELAEGRRNELSHRAIVTLDDLDLTPSDSSYYQLEASVPQNAYEEWVPRVTESHDGILTASGLRTLARNRRVRLSIRPCAWRCRDGFCRRNLEDQPSEGDGQQCPLGYHDAETPHWDSDTHTLRVGADVVKQFKQPARNQERILATFEEMRWPRHVDDPLPPAGEVPAKVRLRFTIWRLKRRHKKKRLTFSGDGTGEGIFWVPICRAIAERLQTESRNRSILN